VLPDGAADGDLVQLNGALRAAGDAVDAPSQRTAEPVITVAVAGQRLIRKYFC